MYKFKQGIVKVIKDPCIKFSPLSYHLEFAPFDNSGWGITKDITDTEANEITAEKAESFYFTALENLGLRP